MLCGLRCSHGWLLLGSGLFRSKLREQFDTPAHCTDPISGSRKPPGKAPSDSGRGTDYHNMFHGGKVNMAATVKN